MSEPLTPEQRIKLAAEAVGLRAQADYIERALAGEQPSVPAPSASKEPPRPRQKPKQRVLPPDPSELPPENVRSLISQRVDQIATAKGHVK